MLIPTGDLLRPSLAIPAVSFVLTGQIENSPALQGLSQSYCPKGTVE